jgi:hypothetical protein
VEEGDLEVTNSGRSEETEQDGYETLLTKLRTENLNTEEREGLQEMFWLSGRIVFFRGMGWVALLPRNTIHLKPGTTPINTRPYRLPESQRQEIDTQVTRLLERDYNWECLALEQSHFGGAKDGRCGRGETLASGKWL